MKGMTGLLVGIALIVTLLLGTGCDTGTTETPQVGANTGTGTLGNLTSAELVALVGSITPALGQVNGYQQAGIWVTGLGKVTLNPDLALLSLGVEVRAKTVEVARSQAATAMTGIIEALKASGIEDNDIKTSYFNISPEYTYQEVYERSIRYNKQVLTGYRVSNTVTAKIRDLGIVGVTIDEVAQAGGDATRIQSVRFSVEDSSAVQVQAREMAVLDALAKAKQFATLTGETRGNLLFISESGGSTPSVRSLDGMEASRLADSAVSTPVSAGELELQVSVQAVFAIGNQ